MTMARLGWILFIVMSLICAALAYQFIYRGKTELAADTRTVILLEPAERDFVLAEMRSFLIAVQQIVDGIEKDNMTQITQAARKVGMGTMDAVPGSILGKLPLAFKKMGHATHSAFDQLALDAEQLGEKEQTLSQLNQILPNCTTCHALYKVR